MSRISSRPTLLALATACVAAGCDRDAPPTPAAAAAPRAAVPATRGEPLHVRVTGHEYTWRLRYPGADGRLDTPDDVLTERHLHLPARTDVQLELCSDDYVYTVYLPEYEIVEMAFPGRPFMLHIATDSAGRGRFLGTQMCGFAHEELLGDLVVHTPEGFRGWMRETAGQ